MITLFFPNADVIEDIIARDIMYILPGNAKHDLMKRNLSPCHHTFKGILMRCLWELTLVSTIQKFGHWLLFSFVQKKRDLYPSKSGVSDLFVLRRAAETTSPCSGKA